MKKTLTDAELKRAIAALEDGQVVEQVCARFGIGSRTLMKLMGRERWAELRVLRAVNKAGGTGKSHAGASWRSRAGREGMFRIRRVDTVRTWK